MTNKTAVPMVAKGKEPASQTRQGYTSAEPQADWQRFNDAMKTIVSVPKEAVEITMEGEQQADCGDKDGRK